MAYKSKSNNTKKVFKYPKDTETGSLSNWNSKTGQKGNYSKNISYTKPRADVKIAITQKANKIVSAYTTEFPNTNRPMLPNGKFTSLNNVYDKSYPLAPLIDQAPASIYAKQGKWFQYSPDVLYNLNITDVGSTADELKVISDITFTELDAISNFMKFLKTSNSKYTVLNETELQSPVTSLTIKGIDGVETIGTSAKVLLMNYTNISSLLTSAIVLVKTASTRIEKAAILYKYLDETTDRHYIDNAAFINSDATQSNISALLNRVKDYWIQPQIVKDYLSTLNQHSTSQSPLDLQAHNRFAFSTSNPLFNICQLGDGSAIDESETTAAVTVLTNQMNLALDAIQYGSDLSTIFNKLLSDTVVLYNSLITTYSMVIEAFLKISGYVGKTLTKLNFITVDSFLNEIKANKSVEWYADQHTLSNLIVNALGQTTIPTSLIGNKLELITYQPAVGPYLSSVYMTLPLVYGILPMLNDLANLGGYSPSNQVNQIGKITAKRGFVTSVTIKFSDKNGPWNNPALGFSDGDFINNWITTAIANNFLGITNLNYAQSVSTDLVQTVIISKLADKIITEGYSRCIINEIPQRGMR